MSIPDQLRDIIGMRSFAQQDPKLEYKREATEAFQLMMESIEDEVSSLMFRVWQAAGGDEKRLRRRWKATEYRKDDVEQFAMDGNSKAAQEAASKSGDREEKPKPIQVQKKTGRNEPCTCGSGKKYKKCCGKNE